MEWIEGKRLTYHEFVIHYQNLLAHRLHDMVSVVHQSVCVVISKYEVRK